MVAAKNIVNLIKKICDCSKIGTQCYTSPSKANAKDKGSLDISETHLCNNNTKNIYKFVRNGVVDILERIPEGKWGYANSKENP